MTLNVIDRMEKRLYADLWRRQPLQWMLRSGLEVRVENLAEWIVYNEIFVDEEYDSAIAHAFAMAAIDTPVHVVDLGANVGFFSLRLADRARRLSPPPALHGLMVEGSPQCHGTLVSRLALNSTLGGMLQAVHGLVGRRDGTDTIFEHRFHAANSVNNPTMRVQGRAVDVAYVDIAALTASMPHIDLLKCDIEGSEAVFLETYPEWLLKVRSAVFELHPTLCDVPRCRNLLAEAGLHQRQVLRMADDQSVEWFVRD